MVKPKVGDVVQIDPNRDRRFGGCFMVVEQKKPWGVQGYVAVPGNVGSVAYYRAPYEDLAVIGPAAWLSGADYVEAEGDA